MARYRPFHFVLLSGLLVACGEGSSSGDGEDVLGSLAQVWAQRECGRFASCCAAQGYEVGRTAECVPNHRDFVRSSFAEIADFPRLRLDVDAARACAEVLLASSDACDATSSIPETLDSPCTRVVLGTQGIGQPCDDRRECAGSSRGEAFCVEGACRRTSALGEPCGESEACRGWPAEAFCRRGPNVDDLGTCVARDDEPAGLGDACAATFVRDTTHILELPAVIEPGSTCRADDGLFCDGGRCAPARVLGEACDHPGACGEEAWCDGGACRDLGREGEPCRTKTCVDGMRCAHQPFPVGTGPLAATGVCSVPLPVGASCAEGDAPCAGDCDPDSMSCVPPFQQRYCEAGLVVSLEGRADLGTTSAGGVGGDPLLDEPFFGGRATRGGSAALPDVG